MPLARKPAQITSRHNPLVTLRTFLILLMVCSRLAGIESCRMAHQSVWMNAARHPHGFSDGLCTHAGKPWSSSKRKSWMSDKRNLQGRRFDTSHVWTFHLYQHFVDMARYELDMVYRFDLTRNLDGQPLQFMFKDKSSGKYLFNVEAWHTGLLPAAQKYAKRRRKMKRNEIVTSST